jgi:hypothetical protein
MRKRLPNSSVINSPEQGGDRQRGIRPYMYKPGQSGNPKGRPVSTLKGLTARLQEELAQMGKGDTVAEQIVAKKTRGPCNTGKHVGHPRML